MAKRSEGADENDEAAEGPDTTADERREEGRDRREGADRREKTEPFDGPDRRLADRRTGLDRRRPHLHYDALSKHPRPERNINDYPLSTDEVEFINAINDYKEKFGRPFPTWSEVLHVLATLGYVRLDDPSIALPEGVNPDDPMPGLSGTDPAA